jgi:hypothetical protein
MGCLEIDVKGISTDCGSQLVVGGASCIKLKIRRSGGICRGTELLDNSHDGLAVVEGEQSYMVL